MATGRDKGRKKRIKSIAVKTIPREQYPQFLRDQNQRFQGLSDEQRLEETIDICARILKESVQPADEKDENAA